MRWFFTALITAGLVIGSGWYFGYFNENKKVIADPSKVVKVTGPTELGDSLYPPTELKAIKWPEGKLAKRPIVSDENHANIFIKEDVPASKQEGTFKFIGEEVTDPAAQNDPTLMTAKILQGDREIIIKYRPLYEGYPVKEGQMLAKMDTALALNEVASKKMKIEVAKAELRTADAMFALADQRFNVQKKLDPQGRTEEYANALLFRVKSEEDKGAKAKAVDVTIIDAQQAEIILKQHEIRNSLPGTSIITNILKHMGEGVKPQETVMQLHNIGKLRIEGFVDSNQLAQLKEGLKVMVEPVEDLPPEEIYGGHLGEVTGVAVSYDAKNPANPRFVSAGEDGKVFVRRRLPGQSKLLQHSAPVTAIACSPAGSDKNLCITGCSDGSIYIWDLDNLDKEIAKTENAHREAVSAIAFSPNGEYFATGGHDNLIVLWNTEDGKEKYQFVPDKGVGNAHQGAITSLSFTKQSQLVSASRDNTLRVWNLREKGAHLAYDPISGRSGTVGKLGVSADGRFMLLDRGKDLQVLEIATGAYICTLQNNASASQFETLAQLSPSNLLLTGGAADGRLQLWKTPSNPNDRGFELRQFVTADRSPVTCAAFSPDFGKGDPGFAVSGTKDGKVYVWPLPTAKEIAEHQITKNAAGQDLRLDMVSRSLEAGKVRIAVYVDNPETPQYPQGRLVPGRRVTLVIQPE